MLRRGVGRRKGGANDFFFNWFTYLLIVLTFRGFIFRRRSSGLGIGFS
jgi:hypothetical protein